MKIHNQKKRSTILLISYSKLIKHLTFLIFMNQFDTFVLSTLKLCGSLSFSTSLWYISKEFEPSHSLSICLCHSSKFLAKTQLTDNQNSSITSNCPPSPIPFVHFLCKFNYLNNLFSLYIPLTLLPVKSSPNGSIYFPLAQRQAVETGRMKGMLREGIFGILRMVQILGWWRSGKVDRGK